MARRRIRNAHGKPLSCCWGPCWRAADDRYREEVPHDSPRFKGEKLVYTFCGEGCRTAWVGSTRPGRGRTRSPLGLYLP